MSRLLAAALFVALVASGARADDAPRPKSPAGLQGTWLFDAATLKGRSDLGRVWDSVVTVSADGFALTKLMGAKGDLKGTLNFDPKDGRAVDLKVSELDLSELLPGFKVPAGTLPAIYRLDGDRLTLCFPTDYARKRPEKFESGPTTYLVTLARAPKDFKDFPKDVTVTVVGADGKPAAGVGVGGFMYYDRPDPAKGGKPGWVLADPVTTAADGTATFKADALRGGQIVARDTAGQTIAFVPVTPARRAAGRVVAALAPEVRVTASVTCDELTKAGQPLGYVNAYLLSGGARPAYWASKDGTVEFVAPAGKYTLDLYGSEGLGTRQVEVVVPADRSEVVLDPIAIEAKAFALMKGKPAPELAAIGGWAGTKSTFADLKGKYVLVEFWGYWCGPCVHSMPVLIELHEKYAGKGLAIVGVHVDVDGEVDTAEKLDAKVAGFRKDLWKGKALPFPSALASGARSGDEGKRGGPVAQYGVSSFPTTILIDREGKVVGQFHARDIKSASSEIEKLLGGEK